MRRVVIDGNAVDHFVDLPGAEELVRSAVRDGQLELLVTHVVAEELAATRDEDRRSRLVGLVNDVGRRVPTGAFVLGYSRLGEARLMNNSAAVENLRSSNMKNPNHTRDALIGATAIADNCALVTNDQRLTARASAQNVEVLTPVDLLNELGYKHAP